ncbi:MAG: hypothetical protein M1825_004298 [Sarcosagium campestre]|nr:MAG: hypothetical protein M1825_004298 [Sarcosagium campestre]
MAMSVGVGDFLAVTKLAWNLYHNCYLVAREAPDEFRQLVNELASLQGVLRTLRDDVNSDRSFLDKLGEARKQTLERCLAGCYDTLRKLEQLVIKYRQLGIGDGLQFWRKIKWVTQQRDVSNLRAKVMIHTCNISLCMSSIGNSSLARIETSMVAALERQQAAEDAEEELDGLTPLARPRTVDAAADSPTPSSSGLAMNGMQRQMSQATLVENRLSTASPDSTPSMSEEDGSDFGGALRKPSVSLGRARKPSQQSDLKVLPPSPRPSEDGTEVSRKSEKTVADFPGPSKPHAPDVIEVVADAMKELSRIRAMEQSSRPLRIVPQDPVHQPDEALKANFQELANDELKIRRLNARDWLRVATWWLLKARNATEHERPVVMTDARGSFSPSSDSRSASTQSYVDLLKASWILYDIVLKDQNLTALLTDENRKLFYNLSDAINEDFFHFKEVDVPDKSIINRQNLNIWELLQPEEESFDDQEDLLPGLENGRWITVEQEDAGEEDEQVLYRTFVNAEIGSKALRMKSRGAPYMLLLSVKEGESEPKVTICNQSGTFSLTRNFTPEDVVPTSGPMTPLSPQGIGMSTLGSASTQPLPLQFGRMKVSVAFQNEDDLQKFMWIPESYFAAVKKRDPRQLLNATESTLFDSSVEVYEVLKASTMKPSNPRQAWQSCNVRVLETVGKEGWRTTRRLAVSSSAGERRPWCRSTFLPLSRVQICRDGKSRQIIMKWSDCSHEVADKTDGNWNKVYSYVYDDSNPNIAINLVFSTQQEATDFQNCILRLSLDPIYSWSSGDDERFVYDVTDSEPNLKQYKGIIISHTRNSWKYSELFYMYRDTDYLYSHDHLRVRFPQVYYADYISNHTDKLYAPPTDRPPRFSHTEKKVTSQPIQFDDETTSRDFMSSLSLNQQLVFSRRVHYITTKPPSRFGSSKSNKGSAEVQIWRKGTAARLASRWEDKVEDKWMTMSVPSGITGVGTRDSNRATLPKVDYERGRAVDMANIIARNPRDPNMAKKNGPITIAFDTVKDREEFAHALEATGSQSRRDTDRDIESYLKALH